MSIIGISGKIGAGKDEVGKIIQYLTYKNKYPTDDISKDYEAFTNSIYVPQDNEFEVRKFAAKLKDIVCLLIGCTREQLEDIDFKNKKLGEEWWTVQYGNLPLTAYTKDSPNAWIKDKLTPRKILQLLGTEAGRNIIHPSIWINALFADYKYKTIGTYNEQKGKILELPNWIITDCRFENEAKAIKNRKGIIIRVNREDATAQDKVNQHSSETALDDYKFDYTIDNFGTIEELIENVKQVLIKEKIING